MIEFNPAGTERRAHERKPLRVQAHLLPPEQPPFAVRLIDISEGGLRIACSVNPPLMSVSIIRTALPSADRLSFSTLEVRVQVMNSIYARTEDGFRVGLQFLTLSSANQALIAEFLVS